MLRVKAVTAALLNSKVSTLLLCLLTSQLLLSIVYVTWSSTDIDNKLSTAPCPTVPQNLGELILTVSYLKDGGSFEIGLMRIIPRAPSWIELERLHPELGKGGTWKPDNCSSNHRVAIVVPYRSRDLHLRTFLNHMHPFLQKQQLHYTIYVVEQVSSNKFNRGMLMNIGFVEALKDRHQWDCFVFHDVDLLPINDHNLYTCPQQPRHMSVAVNTMAYRLMYDSLFGGIEAFTTHHFLYINGFSNMFFGWGGEDDDLYNRIKERGLNLTRYPPQVARYYMLRHDSSYPNSRRESLLKSSKIRMNVDGLSALNGSYVSRVEYRKLCTWIYADINQKYILAPVTTLPRSVGRVTHAATVN